LGVDEVKFRRWEIYSEETVRAPIIVRVDGNNFHKITRICGMSKPLDEKFHHGMVKTAKDLMSKTGLNIYIGKTRH